MCALPSTHTLLPAKHIRNGGSTPLPNSVSDQEAQNHRSRTSPLPLKVILALENGSSESQLGLKLQGGCALGSPATGCGGGAGRDVSFSRCPGPRPSAGSLPRGHNEEGDMMSQKQVRGSGVTKISTIQPPLWNSCVLQTPLSSCPLDRGDHRAHKVPLGPPLIPAFVVSGSPRV